MIDRRRFVQLAAAGAAWMLARRQPVSAAEVQPRKAPVQPARSAPRPNFLFIITDDQRWDALSVVQQEMGPRALFPWFQSPNLDRIAYEGVRFRNAFAVSALCSPSRACFLTGRYNHLNGVATNDAPFPANSTTHATLLRKAGYTTGYFGKWHMGVQPGHRPGFDYSASYTGQGHYFDTPFLVNGTRLASRGWVDDVTTNYAVRFIEANQARPFSMVVGFKAPHGPRVAPKDIDGLYDGAPVRQPPSATRFPPFLRADPDLAEVLHPPSDRGIRDYFTTLAAVDRCVGRLLDTLQRLGIDDRTVVVFTSDNGYYLGEHGITDKRSAYEESMRIPLLLRYPRGVNPNRAIDAMALNIDLAPTFLDLAGIDPPNNMQGRSWQPLLAGRRTAWRTAFLYEYFATDLNPTPTTLAVRTDAAKLIRYPGHEQWNELFDLRLDPYEMRNLYNLPRARPLLKSMRAEFDRQLAAVSYRKPEYAD